MHLMQQDHSCVLNSLNTWWASQNSRNLSQAAQRPLRWIPKPWDRLKPRGRSSEVVMSTWDPYNREETSRCPENTGGVLICRRISKSHNLRSSGGQNIKVNATTECKTEELQIHKTFAPLTFNFPFLPEHPTICPSLPAQSFTQLNREFWPLLQTAGK